MNREKSAVRPISRLRGTDLDRSDNDSSPNKRIPGKVEQHARVENRELNETTKTNEASTSNNLNRKQHTEKSHHHEFHDRYIHKGSYYSRMFLLIDVFSMT